jgi:predicted nucleotidyltransferase
MGLTETPEAEAARILAEEPSVKRVILFGSRARGYAVFNSDMDLIVDAPDIDGAAWHRLQERMEERRSLVVADLHLLHQMPADWRESALAKSVILFERAP